MLSRHTNNKLKSTIHQVVNPPRELWNSRYSCRFMHPVSDMPLNCLENCIDAEHPKQFEDITAGDYLYERLVDLGLIKIIFKFILSVKTLGVCLMSFPFTIKEIRFNSINKRNLLNGL
jgi:hypothetical protein